MSVQELFDGYETVEFASVALTEDDLANKKIYLFSAPADVTITLFDICYV